MKRLFNKIGEAVLARPRRAFRIAGGVLIALGAVVIFPNVFGDVVAGVILVVGGFWLLFLF